MTNEMRRSCVITHPVVVNDGKPFDAFIVELFRHDTDLEFFILYKGCLLGSYFKCENLQDLRVSYASTQWQLAKALNPLIKVSRLVLDAMDKVPESKFKVLEAGLLPKLFRKAIGCETKKEGGCNWVYGKTFYYDSWVDGIEKKLGIGDYIQADCPLALQVLLQFNTEGEKYA